MYFNILRSLNSFIDNIILPLSHDFHIILYVASFKSSALILKVTASVPQNYSKRRQTSFSLQVGLLSLFVWYPPPPFVFHKYSHFCPMHLLVIKK